MTVNGYERSRVFAPLRQPPGTPVAPRTNRLPLLPSGPDGVHGALPHRTQQLTKRCKHAKAEREGFEPSRAFTLRAFQARALGQTMRPLRIGKRRLSERPAATLSKSRISIAKRRTMSKSGANGMCRKLQDPLTQPQCCITQSSTARYPRQRPQVFTASRTASAPRLWQSRSESCPRRPV